MAQGGDVTFGQIADMDVVADARSVPSRIIVAEDGEFLQPPDRNLCDIRHEVVGDAVGIFAHQTGFMCTDGVEVPEQENVPIRIGGRHGAHDVLEPELGLTVGADGGKWSIFAERKVFGIRVSVDGCGGGKDEIVESVLPHFVEQDERSGDVVLVVFPRFGDGFTNSLVAGKMDDSVKCFGIEEGTDDRAVADVADYEARAFAGNRLDPVERLRRAVGQIVQNGHGVAGRVSCHAGMATDIAGTAGD